MGQTAIDGVEGLNSAGEFGEIDGFTGSRQLMWGHVLLLVCAVLYLIWWCIFFRPNAQVTGGALRVFGIACILVAAVAGIAGVVLECFGISKLLYHAADFLFECIPSRVLCHDLLGESLCLVESENVAILLDPHGNESLFVAISLLRIAIQRQLLSDQSFCFRAVIEADGVGQVTQKFRPLPG